MMDEDMMDMVTRRLEQIDAKLDEVLKFRDFLLSFATAGAVKKAALLAKVKMTGGD